VYQVGTNKGKECGSSVSVCTKEQ